LKTKETSAEKGAKSRQRGSKFLKTWDLAQRHGEHRVDFGLGTAPPCGEGKYAEAAENGRDIDAA